MFVRLDGVTSVAGQIAPDDVAALADAGFVAIVNNRPDGEVDGQPSDADVAAAARSAGLDYVAIPVTHAGIAPEQVAAMRRAIEGARGPILAFCRSGTRSTMLWALAEASRGRSADELAAAAEAAGYDLSALAPSLRRLSAQA